MFHKNQLAIYNFHYFTFTLQFIIRGKCKIVCFTKTSLPVSTNQRLKQWSVGHITLCYITLCYVTLHYIMLHCVVLHYVINLIYITICNIMLRYVTLHYVTLNLKQWPVGHIVEAFGRTPHHRFTSSVFALVYVTNHNPCWKYFTDTNTETNTLQPIIRL